MVIRNSKRFIKIFATVALISSLAYILGWSSLLTVKEVKIIGTNSESEINKALTTKELSIATGMRLARVDVRGIKATLSSLNWLEKYEVDRNWVSGSIKITVNEKIGIAKALSENGSILFFDDRGELFTPVSKIQLAKQDNLALVNFPEGSKEDLLSVAQLLKSLPGDLNYLLSNLKGISVGKSGYINMSSQIGNRAVQINWGKAVLIDQKSRVLLALLELPENKAAKNFDLSIPDAPIVS